MNRRIHCLLFLLMFSTGVGIHACLADTVSLSTFDLSKIHQDWGQPGVNKSVGGNSLSIGGRKFDSGVGTHALSVWWIDLGSNAQRFTADVGIDDEVRHDTKSARAIVEFHVVADRKTLFNSGRMKPGDPANKFRKF